MEHITYENLKALNDEFSKDMNSRIAMYAVMNSGVNKVSTDVEAVRRSRNEFSLNLKLGEITNQKASGRCWMFAALNVMRYDVIKNLKLKNFEFSQSYPLFFDKLEKSNYFLEAVLENLNEPLKGRFMAHLLSAPLNDGGQWDMFCNLLKKYGAVPKDVMPESVSSSQTREMNYYLTTKLREFACTIREKYENGVEISELRRIKDEMMYEIYKILCICLGKPPEHFDFEVRTEDDRYIRRVNISPKEFFDEYVGWNLDDYVSLINSPTSDKPFNHSYTVRYLGNVKEGKAVRYLNLEIEELKKAALAQLQDGKPVWFGADVDHSMTSEEGIMDPGIFRADAIFGTEFKLSKGQRLDYSQSLMNHAMALVGVNLDENGKPERWRVENSWGKEKGKEGYYVMSDEWFDEYVFQIVVNKKYLSAEQIENYEAEPIVLEPWDPMGSLAL